MSVKTSYKKERLDTTRYVNIDTGETLSSEHPEITSVNKKNNNLVIISSNEYITIDSNALTYIQAEFSKTESGRILQMADMVYGCYNLLQNKGNDTPHTKDTLMEELEYSRNKFSLFLKRLVKKSVIYYIKGVKDGRDQTWIMLNPTLARKSKSFHTDCVSVFEDLSKLGRQIKQNPGVETPRNITPHNLNQ